MTNDYEVLAEAFGLLARGCKKLRRLFLQRSKGGEGLQLVTTPGADATPVLVEKHEVGSVQTMDTEDFLRMSRAWSLNSNIVLNHLLTTLLGQDTCRADRFKNHWRYNSSARRKWQKISKERVLKEFFDPCTTFLEDCRTIVNSIRCATDLAKIIPQIHQPRCKFERRRGILEAELTETFFINYLRKVHDELPSLR